MKKYPAQWHFLVLLRILYLQDIMNEFCTPAPAGRGGGGKSLSASAIRDIARRVLAGTLALVLLLTSVLYTQAVVTLDPSGQTDDTARLAAMRLIQSDEYANASTGHRLSMMMRHYMTLVKDYEDYELGASIAIAQGKFADAAACTERAIGLYQGERAGLNRLYLRRGYLGILMNDYEDADRWLSRAVNGEERVEALSVRAQVRLELGKTREAVRDADACLARAGEPEQELALLVSVYESAGEYARLADVYTRMLQSGRPGRADFLLERAACYANLGEPEKTAADCAAYLEEGGADACEAWTLTGIGWMRAGRYEEAAQAFGSAADAAEDPSDSLLYYAVLCATMAGDMERASTYGDMAHGRTVSHAQASRLVRLEEGSRAELLLMTARAHMVLGEYLPAAGVLSVYAAENPDGQPVRFLRGTCLLAAGLPGQAAAELEAALDAQEDEAQCRYALGLCRMQTDRQEDAAREFAWVMDNSDDPELTAQAKAMLSQLEGAHTGS